MSNLIESDENILSEDFSWRIAGYDYERVPTLEVSEQIASEYEPHEYIPAIGEALVELGVQLMKYGAENLGLPKRRRPSPHKRPEPVKPVEPKEIEIGGYL